MIFLLFFMLSLNAMEADPPRHVRSNSQTHIHITNTERKGSNSSDVIIDLSDKKPESPAIKSESNNKVKIAAIAAVSGTITSIITAIITLSIHFSECKK